MINYNNRIIVYKNNLMLILIILILLKLDKHQQLNLIKAKDHSHQFKFYRIQIKKTRRKNKNQKLRNLRMINKKRKIFPYHNNNHKLVKKMQSMKNKKMIKRKNKKLIRRKIKTRESLRFLRRKFIIFFYFIFFRPDGVLTKTEHEILDSESS